MKKQFKRGLSAALLVMSLASTTAIAATKGTGNFTYGSFTASGTLTTDFYFIDPDTASARTDRVSVQDKNYKVIAYLETQDYSGGSRSQYKTDDGYLWAQSDISKKGVWSFNSTHAITPSNNTSNYLKYIQLSKW